MKALFCALLLAAFGVAAANADDVSIMLDQPDQSGSPGDTLQFFGTITNNTGDTVFLDSDDFSLAGLSLTFLDDFGNVPISLDPGETSADIELFDIGISDPLLDATGKYPGAYFLLEDSNLIGSADFSVTTTPEPSLTFLLLGVSGALLFGARVRARTFRGE
jgi:hypothetical protein